MTRTVEIPIWLLATLCLFAGAAFASHFFLPSVRWLLRRWTESLVTRLNSRLARPIRPFEAARRKDAIARLVHDPRVASAIAEHAAATGLREDVAFEMAGRYAREIVPAFSAILYFAVAARLARLISTAIYRVRVIGRGRAFARIDATATIVFVMNHRSNMDYVLVTWLAAGRTSISYAVGEWARRWPLRPLIRGMGGFFVRRRDLNPLYRRVLARYVQTATAAGVSQAIFPEGHLSRDGALAEPKLGILSYVVDAHVEGIGRDVVFVPVAIAYDRVLEDRRLVTPGGEATRFRLSLLQVMVYVLQHLRLRLFGRYRGFGRAVVVFGDPLSLSDHRANGHVDPTATLGKALMDRIAAAMPALPVPIVARALMRGASHRADLAAAMRACGSALEAVVVGRADPEALAEEAVEMLAVRGIVRRDGDRVVPADEGRSLLAYYAASAPER